MNRKIGSLFGESIIGTSTNLVRRPKTNKSDATGRLIVFYVLFVASFVLIVSRSFQLMIVKGSYYRSLAFDNRIKEKFYPAPRGVIKDRNDEIIVRNKPEFEVEGKCGSDDCVEKVSHARALELEARGKVSGSSLGVTRDYIDSYAFSHVVGLVGSVIDSEMQTEHCNYVLTTLDRLGRTGVEKAFDCILQGRFGRELIETDADGNEIRTLSRVDPVAGNDLTLSLVKNLQIKAYTLMKDKRGAVVVHNPKTGEILALISSPSFDISTFAEGISEGDYEKLLNDPNQPLFDRSISGTYPPGSIFKTIVAAGGLEEGVIDETTVVEDTGVISVGEFSFSNWYFTQYGKTEGAVTVVDALKRSNDIFFYKTGEALGAKRIADWSRKFKLGSILGIEIEGEAAGVVPDEVWKKSVLGEPWYLGDTYHFAIGQGNLLVTPLQIAYASGAFANNGIICKPTVLKTDTCEKLSSKIISDEVRQLVVRGMTAACSPGGTAYPLFNFQVSGQNIAVSCKTGTAEFGSADVTHAWLTAFAPTESPEIAVMVLVEGGGEGSRDAAPIAKELLTEWFTK